MNAYPEWDLCCTCRWLFCLIIAASLTIIRLLRAVKRTMNCEKGRASDTHDVTGGKFRRPRSERLGKLIKEKFGALRARRACAHFHCTVPLTGEGGRRKSQNGVGRLAIAIHETLYSFMIVLSLLLLSSQNALRGCRNFVQKEDYCC